MKKPQPLDKHLISFMGINALRSSHPGVRQLKRQQQGHSAHGNKVWRSSFVLMDYLSSWEIPERAKVLDIGCGWGLAGIYLAKNYQAQVTGLDIDEKVQPYLNLQAEINHCFIEFTARSFQSLQKSELANYHTLMGTDICFWDEMTSPLFDLIALARSAGTEQILIADPGRPPFWDLAERCVAELGAEIITRRIYEPWKTEKFILAIGGRD
ncbi:MAG: methyltransferase domain-containing protein [Porticoccaceae bacterium]|nr:methyltransferase domain-containing protein [Porticoccaceae bacterium]